MLVVPHQQRETDKEDEEEEEKKIPDKTVESIVVPCVGINKLELNEHSQEKEKALVWAKKKKTKEKKTQSLYKGLHLHDNGFSSNMETCVQTRQCLSIELSCTCAHNQ